MDSRDSSLNRDGSTQDDDGPLSVIGGLAKDAGVLFQSRRFSECIDVLNQLLHKKQDDPKVVHNIAVAEYFRDGCFDPRKLLEVLNKVKGNEDLARASGLQVDVVSDTGSSAVSVYKGSSTNPHQFFAANATGIDYTDEFDTSVAMLNTAIILFHLHEYGNALSVLEPLYQNIAPIDETTALHICLLLLDVALASRDALKAADVIQYLEKAFGVGYMISHGDNGTTPQHLLSNQAVKVSSTPNNLAAPDASNSDSTAGANAPESPLSRTLSDEADYENLLSTLDITRQNLARPSALPSSNDLSRTPAGRPPPAVDLKIKLHLYKVQFLLLSRNLKAAKREVKLAMNIARCSSRDTSTALLLKSQLEYARGNHRKSIKLLTMSGNRTESGMSSMFNNNLGCIYHQLRKHHTSTLFFSKALKNSSSLQSEKPLKLSTFSQDKSLLIVYNCGLQYLTCGRPMVAASCFQKASSVFYNRPLLWLRLAECCLLALEKGLLKSSGVTKNGKEVKVHVVGNGKWRQVVVENRHLDSTGENGLVSANDRHMLSIPYTRQCLLNALHLLNALELKFSEASASMSASEEDELIKNSNHESLPIGDSKAANFAAVYTQASANGDPKGGGASSNTTFHSSVSAYEEMCRKENHMVKQAVLADLAYVELNLENYLKALSAAKALLQLPECSRIFIFLGHVYAAEALCRLNRPKEAAEHLSVYISDGNNVDLPYSDEDRETWRTEKGGDGEELNGYVTTNNTSKEEPRGFLEPEESRGALYVNLAAISAMHGDLEQAHRLITQALSMMPNNPTVVLASVYVDLRLGKTQDSLVKLKQCGSVRFFPSDVTTLTRS
ncbi:uncharacterized protein LOC143849810 isoform X2 [Tasmannia lanceolata]|uniref:uncharacterized protein LOC143849810 isoform X2 n=1 Tax=Tasmannia lanceolata TaxID=3420 RepID=UPI004063EA1E